MSPSRGQSQPPIPIHHSSSDDKAVVQQSDSAYKAARRNFNFLINPASSTGDKPARLRTRALLRTFRYIGQFLFWRLIRWAKYAAVGLAVATVSATAFGTFVSGAGFVLAPTGIVGSITAASIWGVGKYIARKAHKRWAATGGDVGAEVREKAHDEGDENRVLTSGIELGPSAIPW